MIENKGSQPTFFLKCHGCARSGMNGERIKNYLIKNDLKMVTAPDEADYNFIFTCGLFTPTPYELYEIQEFKKLKGELIVCGCLPAMEPEKVAEVFDGRTVISKDLEKIDELFPDFRFRFRDVDDSNTLFKGGEGLGDHYESNMGKKPKKNLKQLLISIYDHEISIPILNWTRLPRMIEVDPEHYLIRISRGCLGNCSYCSIKHAIGRLKSKDPGLIIREVERAVSDGRFKIEIISDDSGAYGLDIGTNYVSLLRQILDVDERIKIEYLQDVHPHYLYRYQDELIDLVKTGRIRSLQTAIQSGSERILKLMNRPTDVERYKMMIEKLKKAHPGIRIRTQVIVGFPSETEEDFNDTMKLLKECSFDMVDVYQYREYSSCSSAEISPKVSKEVMEKRQEILLDLNHPPVIIFSKVNIRRLFQYTRFKLWSQGKK